MDRCDDELFDPVLANGPQRMLRHLTIWTTAILMAVTCSVAVADDLYLACHAGITLAAADFRDMFLGEKQFLGAVRLVPVDNAASEATFLDRVLRMDKGKYATTWAKKSFRDGINPPSAMANDASVLEFIVRTPGSCGYLGIAPPAGVALIGTY
jgi:hypothetical protein